MTKRDDSSAVRAANDLLAVFSRLRRQFFAHADVDDLTPTQIAVIRHLYKWGPQTGAALARAEGVRPQAMTPVVSELARRGLMELHADPTDRRRKTIALSTLGRSLFEGGRRAGMQWLLDAIERQTTETERQQIIKAMAVLDRLSDDADHA